MGAFTRLLRAIAPGLLVALPGALAVWDASVRASWATLGRDQGIFQYVAWASAQGDVLYRDVRDVNGPLVAMVHRVGLMLGGADEHRFRSLDLLVTALVAAFAGGCLASLDARLGALGARARARARRVGRSVGAIHRVRLVGHRAARELLRLVRPRLGGPADRGAVAAPRAGDARWAGAPGARGRRLGDALVRQADLRALHDRSARRPRVR